MTETAVLERTDEGTVEHVQHMQCKRCHPNTKMGDTVTAVCGHVKTLEKPVEEIDFNKPICGACLVAAREHDVEVHNNPWPV